MNTQKVRKPIAVVGYHGHCIDGFTSAWVTVRALEAMNYLVLPIALDYTPASIDGLVDFITTAQRDNAAIVDRLLIVDFSLKLPIIDLLHLRFPKMHTLILDHHKTAFEEYAPDMEVTRESTFISSLRTTQVILDNNESGASLCWNHFHPAEPIPKLVDYVKDYDLWRFEHGDITKYINKYLVDEEKTLDNWDDIAEDLKFDDTHDIILSEGATLQASHDFKVDEIVKDAVVIYLAGYKGLAVACPPELTSDVGQALANRNGTFGAMFSIDIPSNEIRWSLRSNGDFDVSAIAKEYGGGGHKNAAGFTAQLIQGKSQLIMEKL